MTQGSRAPAVQAYWRKFCRARAISPDQRYDVFAFGDTPALADELLALVLAGPKRATAALVIDFERAGDPLPEPGSHAVVLNGRRQPGCIIKATEVTVQSFDQVDARSPGTRARTTGRSPHGVRGIGVTSRVSAWAGASPLTSACHWSWNASRWSGRTSRNWVVPLDPRWGQSVWGCALACGTDHGAS
jgi:uncharacterized protein YhfF